jgi:serine/threonine protein kinase
LQNLDDYLASQPELPTETIFHIIDQLGTALDDLHSNRGVVHNDLKPAQVCLSRKVLSNATPEQGAAPLPSVYLVDYGISCAPETPVIQHGFGGTLIYMVRWRLCLFLLLLLLLLPTPCAVQTHIDSGLCRGLNCQNETLGYTAGSR